MHNAQEYIEAYYHSGSPNKTPRKQPVPKWKRALVLVLGAVFLVAGWKVTAYFVRSGQTKEDEAYMRDAMQENGMDPFAAADASPLAAQEATGDGDANPEIAVDRSALQALFDPALAQNRDTVAGLVAGSDIRAFVVQRDNSYYLTHSFFGVENKAGAVFLDETCSIAKPSRNYILHGHNMNDGTVFGKLIHFSKAYYLDVFPVIRFATLEQDGFYAIFAVMNFSVTAGKASYFPIQQADFATEDAFLQYVREAKARSLVDIPVEVAAGDTIVTLLTCNLQMEHDDRFAVMARKLRPGEKLTDFANEFGDIQRDLYYQKGSDYLKGPDVSAVQQALQQLGYLEGTVDGIYGQTTATAVAAFQTANGLQADGMVGAQTRTLLLAQASESPSP